VSSIGIVAEGGSRSFSVTPNGSGQKVDLYLSTSRGSGRAVFGDGTSVASVDGPASLSVKGVTVSSAADNIALAAYSNGTLCNWQSLTVVNVNLSLRAFPGDSFSPNNEALRTSGTRFDLLGPQVGYWLDGESIAGYQVEIVGSVYPANLKLQVDLKRLVSPSLFRNGQPWNDITCPGSQSSCIDSSQVENVDRNPPFVFDLDSPGFKLRTHTMAGTDPHASPIGTHWESRSYFVEYATIGDVQVSSPLSYVVAVSITKVGPDRWVLDGENFARAL
jgi:hypothetical protein